MVSNVKHKFSAHLGIFRNMISHQINILKSPSRHTKWCRGSYSKSFLNHSFGVWKIKVKSHLSIYAYQINSFQDIFIVVTIVKRYL